MCVIYNMSANPRSRAWCFTINNWQTESCQADYYKQLVGDIAKYAVLGFEVGSSGTPHIQGYIYFENARAFSAMKKLFPRAHLEPAKGTPQEASDYCKKDGDYWECGELPQQGKRSDIDEIRETVKNTGKMREVVSVASSYQSVKMAEQILKYHEKKRDWKTEVKWYFGGSGLGKSRAANEEMPDAYTAMETGKWWEGYDAHEDVIIDDMRKDFLKYHSLLRLLDRYAFRVEAKGNSRQFLAKRIIITTAFAPEVLYETREDIYQLLRRIDEIRHYGENGVEIFSGEEYIAKWRTEKDSVIADLVNTCEEEQV